MCVSVQEHEAASPALRNIHINAVGHQLGGKASGFIGSRDINAVLRSCDMKVA